MPLLPEAAEVGIHGVRIRGRIWCISRICLAVLRQSRCDRWAYTRVVNRKAARDNSGRVRSYLHLAASADRTHPHTDHLVRFPNCSAEIVPGWANTGSVSTTLACNSPTQLSALDHRRSQQNQTVSILKLIL
jgi:hypothetical protein